MIHGDFERWLLRDLWVPGAPKPQGSLSAYAIPGGGAQVVQGANPTSRAALLAWRETVGYAARSALQGPPASEGPVACDLEFALPRRSTTPKRTQTWPCKGRSLDVDKLARSVLDALTGIVYADDAQVVLITAFKRWERLGPRPEVLGPGPPGPGVMISAYAVI